MSTAEFTTEDQLVSDLVEYWNTTRPEGVPDSIPFVHFRRNETLPIPAIIIGHDGAQRETAKGMTGTARVELRVALRTDMDAMKSEDHREIAAIMDRAIQDMTTQPGPLALTYLHALLRQSPQAAVSDRRQITGLSWQVICTRCSAT